MSGHTFKVGDRVLCSPPTVTPWRATVALDATDSFNRIVVKDGGGVYNLVHPAHLSALPLFEPFTAWIEREGGRQRMFVCDGPPVWGGEWVKVLISPAEDQS